MESALAASLGKGKFSRAVEDPAVWIGVIDEFHEVYNIGGSGPLHGRYHQGGLEPV